MSKFTAGKWKYLETLYQVTAFPDSNGDWKQDKRGWPVYPDGGLWQEITGEVCGSDEEEIHANGRLIAAAPEMYRLLSSLFNRCVIIDDCAVDEIRTILARIDGKEEITAHEGTE